MSTFNKFTYHKFKNTLDAVLGTIPTADAQGYATLPWKQAVHGYVEGNNPGAYARRATILDFARRQAQAFSEGHPLHPSAEGIPDHPKSSLKFAITKLNKSENFATWIREEVYKPYDKGLTEAQRQLASDFAALPAFLEELRSASPIRSRSSRARSLAHGHGHNYRQISHRAAYHYGTTKEAWEAGRAW
ncbi:hypothetical protein JCM10207_001357 [Rhodosporidiobolus poonsookiae]